MYEGHFANGLRHGHGILKLANKNYIYDGGWAQDKMHGFGRLKMGNGVHYEGYWDNNQFHGQVGFKKVVFDRELFFCGPRNMKIFLNFAKYNDTDIDLKQ